MNISNLFVKDKAFYKMVLTLALPVIMQNMINIGVNIMDTVMLGSYGEVQISASSLANEFINIFQILCMGMGGGTAVLTAQYWGRGEKEPLRQAVTIMVRISMALATAFFLLTLFFPGQIMSIYTKDPAVIEKGILYFRISAPTYLLMGLSLTLTIVLRSVRKVKIPLYSAIVSFFVNIFFNWVFIFGKLGAPEMQIEGAALGTLIARVVETAIICYYVLVKDKEIGLRVRELFTLRCGGLVKTYFSYSLPVIVSDLLLTLGNNAVSIIMGHIGTTFVAANAIISTVVRLSTVFNQGISSASSIMTGNTIGAGEPDRAYNEGKTFMILSFLVGLLAGGIIMGLSPFIISLYNIEEATVVVAKQLMAAVAIMIVFQAMQSVTTKGVLRGGGDTRFLLIADVLFLWVVSVPMGYLSGLVWGWNAFWVYICLKLDWAIKSLWCLGRFKSRKWIKNV